MPACENTLNFPGALPPKLLACFALLAAISLLSACKDGSGKFGFELRETPDSKKLPLPAEDFDRWGGGPGQTNYATAKNPSMKQYAEEFPHSTLSYGAFGRDFIQVAAKGKEPFCLSISFKAPHMPDTPDPRFDSVYEGVTFTKPKNYGRESGAHFSKQSQQGRQYERFESWGYSSDYDGVMRKYHQLVHGVDQAVGMVRAALEEAGVAGNTVVIFTSDNGFLCGAHGYGSKVLPYEEASRVPLLVYDPREPMMGKGVRVKALTGNVDFMPTLLDLAGVAVPDGLDGRSLRTLFKDPAAEIHESLPLINVWGPQEVFSFGVVTKDWKYVYWPYAGEGFEATEELYEIAYDPLELSNRISDPSATGDEMRARYDAAVAHWKEHAVPYHDYAAYGDAFDRGTQWVPAKRKAKAGGGD